jgi:hypothetical protein
MIVRLLHVVRTNKFPKFEKEPLVLSPKNTYYAVLELSWGEFAISKEILKTIRCSCYSLIFVLKLNTVGI